MTDNNSLVELVELLQQIEVTPEKTAENAYFIYDKDDNKILL